MSFAIKSVIEGACWPALASPKAATVLAVLAQLEETQWLTEQEIREQQYKQLSLLLHHAQKTVPFYHKDYFELQLPAQLNDDFFHTLPILTRQKIQDAGKQLYSQAIPGTHGKVQIVKSSGSTGKPVVLLGTQITRLYWDVLTMRDHLWQQRNLTGKLAIIRSLYNNKGYFPDDVVLKGWGCIAGEITATGETRLLNILSPIEKQKIWLKEFQPETLLTFPSGVNELFCNNKSFASELSSLQEIRTVSEMLLPETRQFCQQQLHLKVVDTYSTNELGYIALQCPENEHYHIQSENILVEILNDDNQPCQPGEIGRIIITALHNYASPLIRYEIGDYAEVGEPCSCGRGLPVIKQIYGRYRNWMTYPDGKKQYPGFGFMASIDIDAIVQYQIIQTSAQDLTIKLVVSRALTENETNYVRQRIHQVLGYPFTITIDYVDSVRNGATGKYEAFISLIND